MSSGTSSGPSDPFLESSATLPAASSPGPQAPESGAASALVADDPNNDLLFYTQSGADSLLAPDAGYDTGQAWSDGQQSNDPFTNGQSSADPWAPYYVDPSQSQPQTGPTNPFTGGGPTEPFSGTAPASGSSFQPATQDGAGPGAPADLGTAAVDGQNYHVYGQIVPDPPPVTTYTFPDDVITATPDSPAHYTFPADVITATADPPNTPAAPAVAPTPPSALAPTPTSAYYGSLPPLPPTSSLPAVPEPPRLAPLPTGPAMPAVPASAPTTRWPQGTALSTQPTMSARDPSQPEIELPSGLEVAQYLGGYITVLQWQDAEGRTQSYTVKKGMPATSDSDPLGTLGPNRNAGGSIGIIAAVMAGANPDQIKTAGEIGQDLADIGLAVAPAAAGLSRELARSPLEPEIEPELPRHPAEDFVNPDFMIDTSELAGSGETALGYTRDSRAFWREMLSQYPWLFSPTNVQRINQGRAPWVDQQWLDYHPGQVLYEGDILAHHHWDQGPMAFGIPEEFHRLFYPELHPFQQ